MVEYVPSAAERAATRKSLAAKLEAALANGQTVVSLLGESEGTIRQVIEELRSVDQVPAFTAQDLLGYMGNAMEDPKNWEIQFLLDSEISLKVVRVDELRTTGGNTLTLGFKRKRGR
jgi:hypothetical protein